MKYFTIFIWIFFSLNIYSQSKDNFTLLNQLKESAKEVIGEYQKVINKNRDGTLSDKHISKNSIAKATYQAYIELSNGTICEINKLKKSTNSEQLAKALSLFLSTCRNVIAKLQVKINTDSDGSPNPKYFYPAVFGRLTVEKFYNKTGIRIKQTTTGKGTGPRNTKYNNPDAWEISALEKIEKNRSDLIGFGKEIIENGKSTYRYIYPLKIKKACLGCHGDPKGEKDISGYIKEGYKLGEIRGGISVSIPLNK